MPPTVSPRLRVAIPIANPTRVVAKVSAPRSLLTVSPPSAPPQSSSTDDRSDSSLVITKNVLSNSIPPPPPLPSSHDKQSQLPSSSSSESQERESSHRPQHSETSGGANKHSENSESTLPLASRDIPLSKTPAHPTKPVEKVSSYVRERNEILELKRKFDELANNSKRETNTSGNTPVLFPAPIPPPVARSMTERRTSLPSQLLHTQLRSVNGPHNAPNGGISPTESVSGGSKSTQGHSTGSVTAEQSDLKQRLEKYTQDLNIQRSHSINVPNTGSAKAIDQIQSLTQTLQKATKTANGSSTTSKPPVKSTPPAVGIFSPSRFTSDGSSSRSQAAYDQHRAFIRANGLAIPSRGPPHTSVEKRKRLTSSKTEHNAKRAALDSTTQSSAHSPILPREPNVSK